MLKASIFMFVFDRLADLVIFIEMNDATKMSFLTISKKVLYNILV